MRIHIKINGFFDWKECPPGTVISPQDLQVGKVKKMQDEKMYMKVMLSAKTTPPELRHHDTSIPESSICERMAVLELFEAEPNRLQVVIEELDGKNGVLKQFLSKSHMDEIIVDDDGPNEQMYAAALGKLSTRDTAESLALKKPAPLSGISSPLVIADMEGAMARYKAPYNMTAELNRYFRTTTFRAAQSAVNKGA